MIGIGVAVAGVVRRADGLVSMAPTSAGWISPSATASVRSSATDLPISIANEADLGALAESRRGAAVGADHILFISGEVGVGGGLIVDGRPFHGRRRLRRRARAHAGQSRRPASAPAERSAAGRPRSVAMRLLRRAGRSVLGGAAEMDRLLADADAGLPEAMAALAETGRWLGIGLAGLRQRPEPASRRVRRAVPADPPVRRRDRRGGAGSAGAVRAARLVRVVPGSLGAEAPLIGAAELALEPVLIDPASWLAGSTGRSTTVEVCAIRRVVA